MRIAISSSGENLNSQLDPRFGRCAYFLVIDPDEMSFEVFSNENFASGGGAGIQSAQFLASKGVDAVITGNCGPNAVQTLSAAGIELFVAQTGTVKKVIEKFKSGELISTREAAVDDHFGMAPGAGCGPRRGIGAGGGRGRGVGGVRTIGDRTGLSGQSTPKAKGSDPLSNESDLEILKKKADDLNKQLKGIIARINKLEIGG
ncbi:MAG: NifB/NifX family molybdenum-iron cluster-binding protein [Deltaproteobacteria bacterium]|jgi:predicted Fe-Mo cluster-binding NifX family protein|nr:NifB/NifX family molybdenum-iron cluster-binding protein [Deltaproteobacteria bacterium]